MHGLRVASIATLQRDFIVPGRRTESISPKILPSSLISAHPNRPTTWSATIGSTHKNRGESTLAWTEEDAKTFLDTLESYGPAEIREDSATPARVLLSFTGAMVAMTGTTAAKCFDPTIGRPRILELIKLELALAERLPTERRVARGQVWYRWRSPRRILPEEAEDTVPVLMMDRLPDGSDLLTQAATGQLTDDIGEDLAHLLSGFHTVCATVPRDQATAYVSRESEQLHKDTSRLNEVTTTYPPPPAVEIGLHRLVNFLHATHRRATISLQDRAESGWIRDVHGDLHMKNIHIRNGQATFLDVMPLDRFRLVDTLRDAAHVNLELERVGLNTAARVFRRTYGRLQSSTNRFLLDYFGARISLGEAIVLGRSGWNDDASPRTTCVLRDIVRRW